MTGSGPLSRRRNLARLALAWEAIWPAIWPALGVLGLYLTIALLGLPLLLPGWARLILAAGFLGAFALALRQGLRGFTWPGDDPADRRLERESGLEHRPLAALTDKPATNDPVAQAVWQVHRDRTLASITQLRVGLPRPGLAKRDPIALRAALGLSLLAALIIAGPEAPERLRRAVLPPSAIAAQPAPLRLEAWVTPPAYTGAAPVFLDPAGGAATVPTGSRLQVALSGGVGGVPDLLLGAGATPFRALDGRSFGAEAVFEAGARLVIRRDGREIAAWTLSVQADAPPQAFFAEPPARSPRGLATRLPWRVEDDWGVAALIAEIRLQRRPNAAPHVIEIPLPAGQPRQARGLSAPDLSAHPWAGLEVEILLRARDGAGQEGVSEPEQLVLPERSFTHPVAQQLIALRKALSLDPTARVEARRELDRISNAPEAFEHDTTTFLALRAARHRLQRDRRPDAVADAQEILWETAIALEEGRVERSARALAEARQQLREALAEANRQQQEQQSGERSERDAQQRTETERRIQELRDAIRRHLEALAERLQRENAESMPYDPQNRLMDRRDLDRRTDRMREANRQDRPQDAERELAELEERLRALEEGRTARNQEQERRRQQRERGQQQMGVVQDMVQRQTRMLDSGHRRADAETQRRDAERRAQQQQSRSPWNQPSPQQQQQQQQQRAEAESQARGEAQREARTQRALRRALGEVMQQFGDLAGEVPAPLGRADQAMREAQHQLTEGRDARDAQGRAIRELVEGARQMAQQMQRQFGPGEGDGEEEGDEPGDMMGEGQGQGQGQDSAQDQGPGRDPLGRRTRDSPGAQDAGSDTRVPDEAELLRTRRLQDELRRRGAERERPPEELDYIDRLLRRF